MMSRGPQSLKESDITKALKAAKKTGFKVRVEIRNGSYSLDFDRLTEAANPEELSVNEWDEVAK
jgi:hypothetical protein